MLTPLHASLRRWALLLALLAVAGAGVAAVTSTHAELELPAIGVSDEHAESCLLLGLVLGLGVTGALALRASRPTGRDRRRGGGDVVVLVSDRPLPVASRATRARGPSPPRLCRFLA